MIVRVQKIVVTVVTTDRNPASVVRSVDVALQSLTLDKHRIYLASASLLGNDPIDREVPDRPFTEPDNDREMRADDDWMNDHIYPLTADD